jgi:hypothetical protein
MIDTDLTEKQAERFWKMAYRLNDNIKTYMDEVHKQAKGLITNKEINKLLNYRINAWNGILRSVMDNKD